MLAALVGYGVAAAWDWRTQRVPNALWVVLAGVLAWTGVTASGVVLAVGFGAVGWWRWHAGDLGGADVKGLALLPIAIPHLWGVALAVGCGTLAVWFWWTEAEVLPAFPALYVGVVAAAGVGLLEPAL